MKVTPEQWREAMNNLMERRQLQSERSATPLNVYDYKGHLMKCFVGKSVLDVGCGDGSIKEYLSDSVRYVGIDAFPSKNKSYIYEGFIDDDDDMDSYIRYRDFETVIAFAVLDGVRDFDSAIINMKAIAQKNIIILTGLDIPVDKYHTFELQMEDFDSRFTDWDKSYCEEIAPKVWLMEFKRK